LPGYTLVSRLGAGGYGEVWLAKAPGGLTKAVKFVYGSYNEKRAEHELRAMQRVKEVRHPFLLSLERIEVFERRLVIVTELAEGSLKDRFDQCRAQGLPGIPRAELLNLLRDAADGLDYLSQKHSLQHLDVKPENLLLVGGHVKVADFGLVKDVAKSQQSLVGGLTPLYSAPEVFQGCPSPHSDQYSLAVLYQEMLTGVMPFAGVTAAELTLQHLHDEPNVTPLPTADRYVLSRALAKDPSQRFATCSELVQALTSGATTGDAWNRASAAPAIVPPVDRSSGNSAPRHVTELFDEQFESCAREASTSLLLDVDLPADDPPLCLGPINASGAGFRAQPTLVIGVGGLAGDVLRQLRRRITRQFGEDDLAAVQMLFLDSDAKAIARSMQGDARCALKPDETLALPLRRPQEYREQAPRLNRWLGRRWLYNIPRSLRTEGMRPLGRLALVDHARQAVQRIRVALSQAIAPEACDASQELTGLEFQGRPPRIYLVASISGGVGSGMSLDVAAAVRATLIKLGVGDAQVIGAFLRATDRDPLRCDLAKVNAYAWLTEYNHFHRPGALFPGDESCGLPPLPPGQRPLSAAYLVDANAADVHEGAVDPAVDTVAEYIYLDALTPAQQFFEHCRRETTDDSAGTACLRTFSLQRIQSVNDDEVLRAAATLCRRVIRAWTGVDARDSQRDHSTPGGNDASALELDAASVVERLELTFDSLSANAGTLIEAQFGGHLPDFLNNIWSVAKGNTTACDALRAIDCLFASPNADCPGEFVLDRPVDSIVNPLIAKLSDDLVHWLVGILDIPRQRLMGAQRSVEWFFDHLKGVESNATCKAGGFARKIGEIAELTRREPHAAAGVREQALAYLRLRIDYQAAAASGYIARRLLAELKTLGNTLSEYGRHLQHIAASFPAAVEPVPCSTTSRDASDLDPIDAALAYHGPLITEAIESQLQQEFVELHGGMFRTIMGNSRVRAQLLELLNRIARRTAEGLAARPDVMSASFAVRAGEAATSAEPSAWPELLRHGGVYRRMVMAPAQCPGAQAAELWTGPEGAEATLLMAPSQEVVAVCEGWKLPLARLAIGVIQNRRDYADFAARVHTRSDIAWTPLTAPADRAAAHPDGFGSFAEAPRLTQAIS